MSKAIALLLFASGLFVAPLLTGAALQFSSTTAAQEFQAAAVSEEDEDIANVDPNLDEEIEFAAASATGIADGAPVTGIAVAMIPVLETTQDFGNTAPLKGFAAPEEPGIIESAANAAAVAEETVQTASARTDMTAVSQMVSVADDMTGKLVMDQNGELMGTIIGFNDETTTIEVELMDGRRITLLNLPTDLGHGVVSINPTDVE